MIVVVDGNDGTGKSTLAEALRAKGYDVRDRGIPTRMTDDDRLAPDASHTHEVYLIVDAPVEVSRARLEAAGKDLNEQYHTVEDLTHYRARFQQVAAKLPRCRVIDSSGTPEETLAQGLQALAELRA